MFSMLLKHFCLKNVWYFLAFFVNQNSFFIFKFYDGNQLLVFGIILVGMIFNSHYFKLFQVDCIYDLGHCEREVFLSSFLESIKLFLKINCLADIVFLFFSFHIVDEIVVHVYGHAHLICTFNFLFTYVLMIVSKFLLAGTVFVSCFKDGTRCWRTRLISWLLGRLMTSLCLW